MLGYILIAKIVDAMIAQTQYMQLYIFNMQEWQSCVHIHTTSKWIELENSGCSDLKSI